MKLKISIILLMLVATSIPGVVQAGHGTGATETYPMIWVEFTTDPNTNAIVFTERVTDDWECDEPVINVLIGLLRARCVPKADANGAPLLSDPHCGWGWVAGSFLSATPGTMNGKAYCEADRLGAPSPEYNVTSGLSAADAENALPAPTPALDSLRGFVCEATFPPGGVQTLMHRCLMNH